MTIVKIKALPNGAHENKSGSFGYVLDGWAVVPAGMVCENFPFGELTAEEIDGVMTVTSWTPLPMPEPEPEPEPQPTEAERLAALEADVADLTTAIEEGLAL